MGDHRQQLLDDFEGVGEISLVALALDEPRGAGRREHTSYAREQAVVVRGVEADLAAGGGEGGDGVHAVKVVGVPPVDALEVKRVLEPVPGVDEGEVEEHAGGGAVG